MNIVQIVDLVIGCLFVISILVGYHRGFVVTVARVAAMIISYAGAVAIASGVQNIFTYPLVFCISFGVLQFFLFQLVRSLRLIGKIPVIGKLDKLAGAVFGFFWVFLLCMIVGHFFFQYIPGELRHQWGFTKKAVEQSVLLDVFAK